LITMVRAFEKLIRPRWSIETIYVLADKPLRYSEIQHELALETRQKVHATTLTASLSRLQAQRLINHDSDRDGHYRLTEAGRELVQELDQIARWSERHRHTLGQ
jgi:DNA-binding HxlR family transcriptional regulator